MSKKPRKRRPHLTLEEKVELLHMRLHQELPHRTIARILNIDASTILKIQRSYCNVTITRTITLKPEKKQMRILLEARAKEPRLL